MRTKEQMNKGQPRTDRRPSHLRSAAASGDTEYGIRNTEYGRPATGHQLPATTTHFARVLPIVGDRLRALCVAVIGLPVLKPVVASLAASGIARWVMEKGQPADALIASLEARHGQALGLQPTFVPAREWPAVVRAAPPDLIIACGNHPLLQMVWHLSQKLGVPALLISEPLDNQPIHAQCIFPATINSDDNTQKTTTQDADREEMSSRRSSVVGRRTPAWNWICAAPQLAGLARAMLLRGTPFARPDLEELWSIGRSEVEIGGSHPFDLRWGQDHAADAEQDMPGTSFYTPLAQRGGLLIVGLGSIGSEAAALLAPHAARLVLADPDSVDASNPVRQHYRIADIGRPKPYALADAIGCPEAHLLYAALDEDTTAGLIETFGITAALVATGTDADFGIARALRERGIPHVVARCYPRARYWEAILDDGAGGPGLEDIRGHLRPGPTPPPTPEQRAAYSNAGALEAEPATLVESGWAAAWAARLTAQLLVPSGLRERWLLELLGDRRTCLVGGMYVEETPGGPAYGVELPGRIRAWGR
jgi:hypothetical protein